MSEENNVIELNIKREQTQKPKSIDAAKMHVTSPIKQSLGKFSALTKGKLTIKDILR